MSRELYFLRSSEQKIVIDMFKYAHPNRNDEIKKYTEFFGFSDKDLGLYALVDGEIAGAIYSRRFSPDEAPTMSVSKKLVHFMMNSLLTSVRNQKLSSFMKNLDL